MTTKPKRPPGRPFRDPAGIARIPLSVRITPATRVALAAEAKRAKESIGQVVDRITLEQLS